MQPMMKKQYQRAYTHNIQRARGCLNKQPQLFRKVCNLFGYAVVKVIEREKQMVGINKQNLIAITNKVIHDELPNNVVLAQWELERISVKAVEKITEELAKQLVSQFVNDGK